MPAYQPPFELTHRMTALVADIAEQLGAWKAANRGTLVPELRRGNRIRSLQASLAIEQNTLSVEQVTAVLAGKPVLGSPKEIQEVRNAFAAYEAMEGWQPHRLGDLLHAHALLMAGLVERPGKLRDGDVGIWRGDRLLHMAPPASQVSLWQTLVLSRWQPMLAWLPVETVVRNRQQDYYAQLARADASSDCSGFVEFMLQAIADSLQEAIVAPARVETPVKTRVERAVRTPEQVLAVLRDQPELTLAEVAQAIGRALSTVERAAARLQAQGRLRHVGPKKGGRWDVV